MAVRRRTDYIVIHTLFTKAAQDVGVEEVRKWHLDRGFSDVGYHFIVRRDGTIESGRSLDSIGAHVRGFNSRSVGCALAGGMGLSGNPEENYTNNQWDSLFYLINSLKRLYRDADVVGHRQLAPKGKDGEKRECPVFDVEKWKLGFLDPIE